METDNKTEKTQLRVPDYPAVSEGEWFAFAVTSAVITLVMAIGLLIWVLFDSDQSELPNRMSIAAGIVTFCGAITTFCTVAWRGLITSRQANTAIDQMAESIKQGQRVERQLQATDANNLTKMFSEAASLLADPSQAKKRAGIALLRHVGLSPAGDFAREALDLLVDYLMDGRAIHNDDTTAMTALKYADDIAKSINIVAECNAGFMKMDVDFLPENIQGIIFYDCTVKNRTINFRSEFKDCDFHNCIVNLPEQMQGINRFFDCRIIVVNVEKGSNSYFTSCDFSGCDHALNVTPVMLELCHVFDDHPPSKVVAMQLGSHLDVRDAYA